VWNRLLDEYGQILLAYGARIPLGKYQYFVIFEDMVWVMENLNMPLHRARRVILATRSERL
jgi:hypothetical protein